MRYLNDKEMVQYMERELLPGLAEDCAALFYEQHGLSLDLTPESLALLDARMKTLATPGDDDVMVCTIGGYLAAVLARTDGARWSSHFNREDGVGGFRASRLRVYNEEVDIFDMAHQAFTGHCKLSDCYRRLHRQKTPGQKQAQASNHASAAP